MRRMPVSASWDCIRDPPRGGQGRRQRWRRPRLGRRPRRRHRPIRRDRARAWRIRRNEQARGGARPSPGDGRVALGSREPSHRSANARDLRDGRARSGELPLRREAPAARDRRRRSLRDIRSPPRGEQEGRALGAGREDHPSSRRLHRKGRGCEPPVAHAVHRRRARTGHRAARAVDGAAGPERRRRSRRGRDRGGDRRRRADHPHDRARPPSKRGRSAHARARDDHPGSGVACSRTHEGEDPRGARGHRGRRRRGRHPVGERRPGHPNRDPLVSATLRSTADLMAAEDAHTSGLYTKRGIVLVRGDGATVFDSEGRAYIDCVGGQGMANLGHGNAAVADAIAEQARTLASCTELFYSDRRAELYGVLAAILPASLDRVFLCNSGTEAVEGALKFARAATKRTGIVATMRGFHGKTMGALSATWGPEYRDLFGPLVPGFSHIPFNKTEALDAAITAETAAFIFELVQGEGGVRPASREFAQEAARLCAERGALLIVDEVQTGFGRTGTLFAIEQYGIAPDILCLAKSIAGGIPMGAVAFSRKVGDLAKRSHSTTFGGNPLACAAAIAAIGEIQRLDLARNARARGTQLIEGLRAIRSDRIREVRGLGLLVGVELKENASTALRALQDEGVLALGAGPTVVRI